MISDMTMDQTLDFIKSAFETLKADLPAMEQEIAELERHEMYFASEWWRDDKYLYLIFPTDKEGNRERKYIGCDQGRIAEARQAIARYEAHRDLQKEFQQMKLSIRAKEYDLRCLVHQLNGMLGDRRS